jgi:hypothetical protein
MAWTQADIDTLKKAIQSGVRSVQFGDHQTVYQDTASMIRALRLMEAEVAAISGTPGPSRTIFIQHGRGV